MACWTDWSDQWKGQTKTSNIEEVYDSVLDNGRAKMNETADITEEGKKPWKNGAKALRKMVA